MSEIPNAPRPLPRLAGRDLALLLFLGAVWGSAFPVIRWGLLAGASPLLFATVRCALGGLSMGAIALASRQPRPTRRSAAVSAGLGGALLIGGYFAFLYVGEEAVPGGLASVLVATNPIWAAGLSFLLLTAEKPDLKVLGGLGLGFAGIVAIFLPSLWGGSGAALLPLVEVLVAPALFALGSVLLRRLSPAPQGPWGISIQLTAGAGVLLLATTLTEPSPRLPLTEPVGLSLLFLLLAPTCVGYIVYFHLHHRVGPTQANLVSYVSPLSGLAVGGALLAEVPSAPELGGFALIAGGLTLIGRRGPPASPPSPPGPPEDASGPRAGPRT